MDGVGTGGGIPVRTLLNGVPFVLGTGIVNIGQAGAIRESIPTDGGHAVADHYGGQTGAIVESGTADGCHAVTSVLHLQSVHYITFFQ